MITQMLMTKDKQTQAAILRYTFTADTKKIYKGLTLTEAQKREPDEIIKWMYLKKVK